MRDPPAKFGKFGKAATAGIVGLGAAGIATGTALFKIGESFDAAYDTIRVGTGKTGKALDGLKLDCPEYKVTAVRVRPLDGEGPGGSRVVMVVVALRP